MPLFVLVNTDTANLVATYQSEVAALIDVADAVRRYGPNAAEVTALSLTRDGEDVPDDGAFIAEGAQLVQKALAAVETPASAQELMLPTPTG